MVTGQKSGKEIWQDVSGAGKAYAKPFMDLKGEDNRTMLTIKEQESYDAGRNDVNAAVRVVDTVTAVAGGASLVKNGVKVLKGGGKKSGHADGDGAKGGVPHGHGDGPDGTSGGAMKDGKLKTNAALMPSSLAELGERISQALGNMTAGAAASVPWRVQRVRLSNGQTVPVIVKNDSHMFSEPGGNRGKGNDSGNSKGSPSTSHVDSRESSMPKGTISKESSNSSSVTPVKPKDAPIPKEAPSSKDGTKVRDGDTEGTGKGVIEQGFTPYENRYALDPKTGQLIDFNWVTTRKVDLVADAYIVERVSELKSRLSNTVLKKGGNFGYAEVDIPTLNQKEFYSSSQVDQSSGNPNLNGFSFKPEKPVFKATKAPDIKGDVFIRDTDTEYKILNDLAEKILQEK
ncbi:hypothetical protein J4O75_23335 [Paenibacillus pabuli]